jgi:hypothetical protein
MSKGVLYLARQLPDGPADRRRSGGLKPKVPPVRELPGHEHPGQIVRLARDRVGKTFLEFYYNSPNTVSPLPVLRDVATQNFVTPADPRWQEQLVSSMMSEAYVTYSKDGTVVTTERAGGKTDLWSTETGKFLTTINDPTYSDDSDYAVVGEHGSTVVIFGGKTTPTGHEFRQLYVWNTGLS